MLLFTCALLSFISYASLEDGFVHTSRHISWEEKLHDYLESRYPDVEIQGSKPRNTTVSIRFLLKTFNFFNEDKEFEIYTWMFISWNDQLLEWIPKEFDNIDSTYVSTFFIWIPDIKMDNDISYHADVGWRHFVDECQVTSSGKVHCVARMLHTVICQTRLSNWPCDLQTCHLNYTSKQTLQKSSKRGISTIGAEYGTRWNIIASNYTLDSTKSKITLTFVVERLAYNLATMYVIPLIVIAILNFVALTIDFESKYRIYILCFCLLSHFMFMQEINSTVPLNGYETPKVLIYLRSSLVMSAISILVTFMLRKLRKKSNSPPVFIYKFNKLFLDGSRKVFLWSKWIVDSARISTEDAAENWRIFANVMNCLNIAVYCVVYPILFLIYIPRPSVE